LKKMRASSRGWVYTFFEYLQEYNRKGDALTVESATKPEIPAR
jgi:hypothetical protein